MFFNIKKKKENQTPDEIFEDELISKVNEGQEQGAIRINEAAMIQNILSFDEKDAKDIMVHRKDIKAIYAGTTLSEVFDFVTENHYSRYPVYEEDIDDIIGLIHIKDLFSYIRREDLFGTAIRDIEGLIRDAESVPETHGIDTLFTTMQLEKSHMVIVVDEYGQTAGLIAMEDILEEIVGNIQDEHDEEEESVSKISEDYYLCNGHTPLSEIEEKLGVDLGEDFEILNGLLVSLIGRVPDEHETFSVEKDGIIYEVLDVSDNMIQDVKVRKNA